jgi:Ca2+-binding EF-hand superfamily protein
MLFKDSALLDRIFRVFDADDDNEIIFSEYLSCMSSISSKATREEKLKCKLLGFILQHHHRDKRRGCTAVSFQIYDFDGDGFIRYSPFIMRPCARPHSFFVVHSVGDLTAVLAATLREHKLTISRADIDHVVKETFAEADTRNEGMISLEE